MEEGNEECFFVIFVVIVIVQLWNRVFREANNHFVIYQRLPYSHINIFSYLAINFYIDNYL